MQVNDIHIGAGKFWGCEGFCPNFS